MPFTTQLPVDLLNPHQALALVNRWVKVDRWYPEDKDALYNLKHRLLSEWWREGTLQLTGVLERDSPAIGAMREQLATGGTSLGLLNDRREDLEFSEHFKHFSVLDELTDGGISTPLPEDVQTQLKGEYRLALSTYNEAMQKYKQVQASAQQTGLAALETFKALRAEVRSKVEALLQDTTLHPRTLNGLKESLTWLQREKATLKQISQIKRSLRESGTTLEVLEQLDLPTDPPPVKPEPPKLYYNLDLDEYLEDSMSLPKVEAALEWARTATGKSDLALEDVDTAELEELIKAEVLSVSRAIALEAFQGVLDGRFKSGEEVYEALTGHDLDYEVLGMRTYRERGTYAYEHGRFSQWHSSNLSLTGYWLVECKSTVDDSLCFHIPYDRALELGFNVEGLPQQPSEQETFGRMISPEEQREYPIRELLKLLGVSAEDFPHQLAQCIEASSLDDWDDDWDDELGDDID